MEENDKTRTSCQEHSSLKQTSPSKKEKIKTKNQHAFIILKTNIYFFISSSTESLALLHK